MTNRLYNPLEQAVTGISSMQQRSAPSSDPALDELAHEWASTVESLTHLGPAGILDVQLPNQPTPQHLRIRPLAPNAASFFDTPYLIERSSYLVLAPMIHRLLTEDDCVVLTGTPGIGKSLFGFYYMDWLLKSALAMPIYYVNDQFVLERTSSESPWIVVPQKIFEAEKTQPLTATTKSCALQAPVEIASSGPTNIALRDSVALPRPENATRREALDALWLKFGGIARFARTLLTGHSMGDTLLTINSGFHFFLSGLQAGTSLLSTFATETAHDGLPGHHHHIFQIFPLSGFTDYEVRVPTSDLRTQLYEKIEAKTRDALLGFVLTKGVPSFLSRLQGDIWEDVCHSALTTLALTVHARSLQSDTPDLTVAFSPGMQLARFNKVDTVDSSSGYWVHETSNFPSIDAVIPSQPALPLSTPTYFLQMTLNPNHPIVPGQHNEFLNLTRHLNADPINLIFIVPPSLESSFNRQPNKTGCRIRQFVAALNPPPSMAVRAVRTIVRDDEHDE
ncbi:hypothetical protein PAPYR_10405 [Paratrimastix pyriformis]|uniref:Uncharacterized protein n=1 Tax=Paratrimastix pyriformis TaxID=342808 RepID=A0ABQ8U631_9EUKA|nr:hypothetical protein PAPYR_10405 [Paratrimastix pyriformis]